MLRARRFLPLFVTQMLGALNDNLFKNALGVLALFASAAWGKELVAIGLGVFILPYVLFSSLAGELADRGDKARLIRLTKLWELGLMLLGVVGFLLGSIPLLMAVLFGLGVQATFFSPLKYGILPDHLPGHDLVAGNGLIEAGTFLGILAGTIAGSALVRAPHGPEIVAGLGVVISLAGIASAWAIPPAPPAAPRLPIGWNLPRETLALLRLARGNREVWISALGISWFWAVGAIVLSELPVAAKDVLGGDAGLITLLLAVFSVGVGVGSVGCARLLHGEVSPRLVPLAALGISLFTADFAHACTLPGAVGRLATPMDVLAAPVGWRLLADLFLLALCGGVYSVSLYAFIQQRADPAQRSRMIAMNNVLNAAFMVVASGVAAGLTAAHVGVPQILLLTAAANLLVAMWLLRLLPPATLRALYRPLLRWLCRAEVTGLEHYRAAGDRVVIVVNHLSLADGPLVAAFLPDAPAFAVNLGMARKWWVRPVLAAVETFLVDPANPLALRGIIGWVKQDRKLVVFPEGRLTRTGALMKVYDGAGLVADRAGAMVLPIHIDGTQFTPFARMPGRMRRRLVPRLRMHIHPPLRLAVDPALTGRARRRALGNALQDVMVGAAFASAATDRTLFGALLAARDRFGAGLPIAEDIARQPISYRRLVTGAVVLGRHLDARVPAGERIGVLLPTSIPAVVSFFALQAFGRVPAMLNFSAGAEALLHACAAAEITTIVTARAFVARARLDAVVARLQERHRILWLEDLRAGIGRGARLRGMLDALRADRLPGARGAAGDPAVVLFTSGSEGTPKGVVLSHRNLLSNCAQLLAVADVGPSDRMLNAMPLFHAFGLTGGTLLPLLHGVSTVLYPSPLHYRVIPELLYDTDSTIVIGTDTFLAGWTRFAHPYDFRSIRFVVAGAEKLREETRRTYADCFGVRILEGYGITEAAPVLAVNAPMEHRPGTAGRLLPGIEHRLLPVEGMPQGGRLLVRGPNVMLGYFRTTAPGVLEPPPDGWADTGDIVTVDADGFITIRGRAGRFAKVAGEMVSMAAAEELVAALWPDDVHAVLAEPDPRKGERLVLVTTRRDAETRALVVHAAARGVAEMMVPRVIVPVDAIPRLGSGKIDYPALQRLLAGRAAA
ncbi:acyl-[ACP]--phospholipid O-acyltransferase [Rhodovastum atsumiense]|uniref:Acyl-[ACP]--phospholipid O-acyltransferase n=1 Tax=Rhodovastum atsumiense TaxID=504468 RepID=A0A5M6J000_9PROT|nr:acyl-[ACP]--phospholipid O-acyltransferase [Rhodovastum atsumiense]